MNKHNKIYIIDARALAQIEEIIAQLQCIFLDIFSNCEVLKRDE